MALEDVGSIEALFGGGARAGTETADHCAFVVGEGVAVFVVFARESLGVVFAGHYGAFFGSLGLVGEHVCFEIFEDATAVGEWAAAFFFGVIIGIDAAQGGASLGATGLCGGD